MMRLKKTVYPLNQLVVSKAGKYSYSKSLMSSSDRYDQVTASNTFTSQVEDKQCIDIYKALVEVNDKDSAGNLKVNPVELYRESNINKFWQIEVDCLQPHNRCLNNS